MGCAICGVGVSQRDAHSVGYPFNGSDEIKVFDFSNKCDCVTAFLAAEAVEESFFCVHRK
jgi:hypothetical protein